MAFRWIRDWRRRRVLAQEHLVEATWDRACSHVRATHRLTATELTRLRELSLLFLHEKDLIPVEGLELHDHERYAIAIQACIPILYLGIEAYRGWRSIYVFPGVMRERPLAPELEFDLEAQQGIWPGHGVSDEQLAGVALQGGGIALAWSEASHGFDDGDDGYNPIIHEFAHQLDMVDGAADGRPELPASISNGEWCATFTRAFDDFGARLDRGEETHLDAYAATDPSEFFAVCSEVFFEAPELLEDEYPDVADLLRAFYLRDRE